MQLTTVHNLANDTILEYMLPPDQAVIAAYAQETLGDYNTWLYPSKYKPIEGKKTFSLGDWCAIKSDYTLPSVESILKELGITCTIEDLGFAPSKGETDLRKWYKVTIAKGDVSHSYRYGDSLTNSYRIQANEELIPITGCKANMYAPGQQTDKGILVENPQGLTVRDAIKFSQLHPPLTNSKEAEENYAGICKVFGEDIAKLLLNRFLLTD